MGKGRRAKKKMKQDGISLLPDNSLVEIISRLDSTEEAIRTSILSKRWKHLWTQVPVLVFVHLPFYQYRIREFFSHIEKVVSQRGQSRLNKFKLCMTYDGRDESKVSKWIRYAVTCIVQDLDLCLGLFVLNPSKFVLDQSFFINSSFTHLKLGNCLFDNATGVISWSNLKLLSITGAKLDEDLVKNILSGSPILETLHLICCHGFGRIDITSPSVNKLVVSGYGKRGYIADILEIYAPHILSLTIEDQLMLSKVVLLNVSSLVEARLDYWMTGPLSREEKEEMLKGQIVSLRCVKKLKTGFYIAKIISRLEAKGYTFPSNMKYPELSDQCNHFEYFHPVNNITDSDWSTDNEGSDNDSIASED